MTTSTTADVELRHEVWVRAEAGDGEGSAQSLAWPRVGNYHIRAPNSSGLIAMDNAISPPTANPTSVPAATPRQSTFCSLGVISNLPKAWETLPHRTPSEDDGRASNSGQIHTESGSSSLLLMSPQDSHTGKAYAY